jgi:flavin reductase (DIM6/NTAB) family NADH-FMN oxidoreductase RutF
MKYHCYYSLKEAFMPNKSVQKPFPISKAFRFIEPGPVILFTTSRNGKNNIMTMSWHMCVDFTPQFACIIGPWDYSYDALHATKECVISIPSVDMAPAVIGIGTCTGKDTDKFKKFGLTPLPAKDVQAPLIGECIANIECRVADDSLVDKYGLFVLDGVNAWINPAKKGKKTFHANGDGTFVVDGRPMNFKRQMRKLLP